jgi:death-on-curing protein
MTLADPPQPVRYLLPPDLLLIHHALLLEFGGLPGVTQAGFGRLDTAAFAPQHGMFGQDLYPELVDKVAALVYGIISNHPFSDGNKRVAVVALDVMLALNGATLVATNDEVYDLALAVASGMPRDELRRWIVAHCPDLPASEEAE